MTAQIHVWSDYVCPFCLIADEMIGLPAISPQPHTELAFRGALYALDQGRADVYHRHVMTAFFRENLDIGASTTGQATTPTKPTDCPSR